MSEPLKEALIGLQFSQLADCQFGIAYLKFMAATYQRLYLTGKPRPLPHDSLNVREIPSSCSPDWFRRLVQFATDNQENEE
jgi:hypothetical protein